MTLRPIHSEVVRLHYVLGYDTAKTAALLGRPRSAIKMRLHRARAALRTFAAEEVQALPPAEQRSFRDHVQSAGGSVLFPDDASPDH